MKKDYSKDFNIKFYGLIKVNVVYEDGKVVSIKEKKKAKELLGEITKFKEHIEVIGAFIGLGVAILYIILLIIGRDKK